MYRSTAHTAIAPKYHSTIVNISTITDNIPHNNKVSSFPIPWLY